MLSKETSSGLVACLILACFAVEANAQSRGFGNVAPSPYRRPRDDRSVNRSFGNAGSNRLSVGSRLNSRMPGPKLGNRPVRNAPPVLSNFLNLDQSFIGSEEGQFLMRTVPFDQNDAERQNLARNLGALQSQVQGLSQSAGAGIGAPLAPIQSGLSTTGHPTSFLNTGSFFPGAR